MRYANERKSAIIIDEFTSVPCVPGNSVYDEIISSGVYIALFEGGLAGPASMVYTTEPDDVADDNIPDLDGGGDSGPVPDVESADNDSADWGSLDTSDSGGSLAPFAVVEGDEQTEVATGEIPAPEIDATSLEHPSHEAIESEPEPELEPELTAPSVGVLIQGDALKTAKMERSWLVDEHEAGLVDQYNIAANEARLAVLRSMAIGAREGSLPPLTETEAIELQDLDAFASWLLAVRSHAHGLRKAIREVSDGAALDSVDIEAGWPVA